VQLVDEEDDVAARADLLQHLLETFLEITAVARPRDERAEVECVELLGVQRLGNVVVDDVLRETFDDRGLADARLTDQHRVVLGAPGKDLHDAFHFRFAPDDRVQLVLTRGLGQVAAELVQDHGTGRSAFGLARA